MSPTSSACRRNTSNPCLPVEETTRAAGLGKADVAGVEGQPPFGGKAPHPALRDPKRRAVLVAEHREQDRAMDVDRAEGGIERFGGEELVRELPAGRLVRGLQRRVLDEPDPVEIGKNGVEGERDEPDVAD